DVASQTMQDSCPIPPCREGPPMNRSTNIILAFALSLLGTTAGPSRADNSPGREEVTRAVTKGLGLVPKAAESYPNPRPCFSCHHQTLPMLAMVSARDRGVAIDEALLAEQGEFSFESFQDKLASMRNGAGVGGGAMTVGYALWAFDLAGR